MNKSESITELNKALANFHKEVKQPMKDANNPFFKSKYVPLENVVEAIDDVAPKFGLTYSQYPVTTDDGKVGISTLILHESGEFIEYPPATTKPDKNTPQGVGSALTYMRRYALSAVFGITSDQDDDGNEASGKRNNQNYKQNNAPKMASSQTIGTLKQQIISITDLMKEKGRANSQQEVEEKFGVNGYNLTEDAAAQIIRTILATAKKYNGGNE
ncbi:ERF family protein [Staphylococcus haemolyticus]|uniref:ERF family protein n=1 Tax=Staphylococcus haemolyticus TaxID=1283 RepID=UPI002901D1EE|nr:ERF family protein [Staphylococcus haemolyticus]MDU0441568.1 ERF family protein [Staphylococcus haemolyticus]MDU0473686.1 ERF family protein [Staphylococcus haemolyticus]